MTWTTPAPSSIGRSTTSRRSEEAGDLSGRASHIHRGRVNADDSKLIATGWINAGRQEEYLKRLAR